MSKEDIQLFKRFQASPIFFIEKMWGLTPQPLKEDFKLVAKTAELSDYKVQWFKPFIRGEHVTWQQWVMLLAIEKALRYEAPKRLSVRSGHGIGKDAFLSWLILWYLFCFKDSQIPATAPTSEQIHDILWKEIAVWKDRMKDEVKNLYDWTRGYVRIKERPETWFARARTAVKEKPEALAGIHGDYVLIPVDEASGVPNEIFRPAEGALTNENVFMVLISNPTRLIGYFYDSHHSDKDNWQTFRFSSKDSPIVEDGYVHRIADKYGIDSDEYKFMVEGEFPKADAVDDQGYVPLLLESDLKQVADIDFIGDVILTVDPSGEGSNKTEWVARDEFKMKVMATEKTSTPKSIAQKTMSLMDLLGINKEDAKYRVVIDAFGEGGKAIKELALLGINVCSITVGEKPNIDDPKDDKNRIYLNKRAMGFDELKKWLRSGGELVRNKKWSQLLIIRYRRELSDKMKIMGKKEMRREGIESPDVADCSMLSFLAEKKPLTKKHKQKPNIPFNEYQG